MSSIPFFLISIIFYIDECISVYYIVENKVLSLAFNYIGLNIELNQKIIISLGNNYAILQICYFTCDFSLIALYDIFHTADIN